MPLSNADLQLLKKNIKDLSDDEKTEYRKLRQKQYQQNYRDKLKANKEPKPIKEVEKIPVKSKKTEIIKIKPQWYNNLIKKYPKFKINDKDYIEHRAYTEKQIEDFYKKITKLLKNIFNIDVSAKTKSIVVSIFRGKNVEHGRYKTNLDSFNNEFKMFNQKNIVKTLEKIASHFKNMNNTIKNNITPFVNLFSRISSYENTYQIMTNYNIDLNKKYIEKREDNTGSDEELEKLTEIMNNYDPSNPEDTKQKINDAELNSKQRAISALYLLMPTRRLDYKIMKLTNTENDLDENFNYLYIKNKKSKFIFNNYKTAQKGGRIKFPVFGKQTLEVNDDVLEYLKQHIRDSEIKSGDLLFGEMSLSTYSKMIMEIMEVIFGISGIGSTTLRIVNASYNQQDNTKSVKQKKELAKDMAHDLTTNALYSKITNVRLDRDKQTLKKNKIPIKNDIDINI